MLYQYAALNANYEAVLKQANSANAELSRRIDSGQKASFSNWECKQCDTTQWYHVFFHRSIQSLEQSLYNNSWPLNVTPPKFSVYEVINNRLS